jgi:diaminohydroxyphosphoribosylaminopyrimidine deaminase/5-amino-6-(5-phosphoribosylamino)uracil reductase
LDIEIMQRALKLAERGAGWTNPNPMVGAVIVKDGRIIGEGWHKLYGSDHAEVDAFRNATEDVRGADMYVTLEPCSHYGKTPPCAKAIIENGIKRVFVGLTDPNPLVSGRGIRMMRDSGIHVESGFLEEEGRKLNEVFLKYITTGIPFCVMKTAMTLDGKIATAKGDSKWITGELSRKHVHELRHRLSGIMVGIGTVLADDPMLTARLEEGEAKDPVRIVVDSRARTPLDARVFNPESKAGIIIAVTGNACREKVEALEARGAEVIVTPSKDGGVDLGFLMKELGRRRIDSVLLEGGGRLNYAALQSGAVDKVNAFIAPKLIGGETARTPVEGEGIPLMRDAIQLCRTEFRKFGEDIMVEGYISKEVGS